MHAILLFASSGLCGISSSMMPASAGTGINSREIANGALHVASQRSLLQPSCSGISSEQNRRGRPRKIVSLYEEASKLNKLPTPDTKMPRPSNKDDIIELFRRIQLSISRGSATSRSRSRKSSRDAQSADSVSGTLQRYPGKRQENDKSLKEVEGSSTQKLGASDGRTPRDIRASRPQSNFFRKSPISPAPSKESVQKLAEDQVPEMDTDVSFELQKLEEMKLTELKEFARTKGVKGYSKLKKGGLVELLKGVLQSSS